MDNEQIKLAFKLGYEQGVKKQAGALSDLMASFSPVNLAVSAIPYASFGMQGAGIAGALNPASEKEEAEYDKHPILPWLVPGVATYRNQRRWSGNAKGHRLSQVLGHLTSALTSMGVGAGLGAGIGALVNKNDRLEGAGQGAMFGGGIGAGAHTLGTLAAAIAAASKKRRTDEEQEKYLKSPVTGEYLIPGLAAYNHFKTIGNTIGKSKRRREAAEAADKEQKDTQAKKDSEVSDLEHQLRVAQLKHQLAQLA